MAKRIDDSHPELMRKKNQNRRKGIQDLIHKMKRDDLSRSPVKLESSEGKIENSEGEDDKIMKYEIVYEFMGTKNNFFSV